MKPMYLVAFISGALFALGLGLSGMTQPSKVIGFLDVLGAWDPSLAFVMIGAIAVHMSFARRALRPAARPLLAERMVLPTSSRIDRKLIAGAALFGLGRRSGLPGPGARVARVALMEDSAVRRDDAGRDAAPPHHDGAAKRRGAVAPARTPPGVAT